MGRFGARLRAALAKSLAPYYRDMTTQTIGRTHSSPHKSAGRDAAVRGLARYGLDERLADYRMASFSIRRVTSWAETS